MSTSGWEGILRVGEEVVWQGQPRRGVIIRPGDIFQSLFGVVFAGFAVFWMMMAGSIGSSGPGPVGFFWLFGIPFLLIGLHMVAGRYFWQAYVRAHTFYTLTTNRAFIATDAPLLGKGLKDYPITADSRFELAGHDTIYFAEQTVRTKNGTTTRKIGFELVDNPTEVMAAFDRVRQEIKK